MRSLGQNPSEQDLQDMINEYDEDGNGIIDFSEFLVMMNKAMNRMNTEDDLRYAFRVFDKNNKGEIPVDELRNVFIYLRNEELFDLTDEESEELFKSWDKNGSGDMDYTGKKKSYLN